MRQTTPWSSAVLFALPFLLGLEGTILADQRLSSRVQKVRQLYQQLYFDDAAKLCNEALEQGKNRRVDLIELLRYQGLLAAVRGKRKAAQTAFRKLLVVNPLVELGEGHPPRVRRAFKAARKWFTLQKPLMVDVTAPEEVLRQGAVEITMEVSSDPFSMVARAALRIRAGGTRAFVTRMVDAPASKDDTARWSVDLAQLPGVQHATQLEYYVVAVDERHNVLSYAGSPGHLRSIRLAGQPVPLPRAPARAGPARAEQPWFERWWLWAVVGTVVGVATIAIIATTTGPDETVNAPVTIEAP
jgi:hypothetical protein